MKRPAVDFAGGNPYLLLGVLAASVNDLEASRIAAENRLRTLLRPVTDGDDAGFGFTEDNPAVMAQITVVDVLVGAERDAIKALERTMLAHPLGPWVKFTTGVGLKQAARLIAAIRDPYWNDLHDRPRTVSELWAFSGYHTLPVGGQWTRGAHTSFAPDRASSSGPATIALSVTKAAPSQGREFPTGGHSMSGTHASSAPGGASSSDPAAIDESSPNAAASQGRSNLPTEGQSQPDAHLRGALGGASSSAGGDADQGRNDTHSTSVNVAARRTKGQRSNWSTDAKTRAYLIAESCIKHRQSPYRFVYDIGRKKYAESLHGAPCVRCGSKGKPAQPGSPLSLGHQHARAMRLVSKELLKDLWRESRRLHLLESGDLA